MYDQSISTRQGFPLSTLLYVLAFVLFFRKLMLNPIVHGISIRCASTSARHSTNSDDVSVIVLSRTDSDKVSKEIRGYGTVPEAKINSYKSVGLRLDA